MTEWQPIETAPKDSQVFIFLYCDEDKSRWLGSWQGRGDEACWYGVDDLGLTRSSYGYEPTHWMPLPAPPETK